MGTNGCLKMKEGEPLKRDNSVTQHSQFLSVAHLFDSTAVRMLIFSSLKNFPLA